MGEASGVAGGGAAEVGGGHLVEAGLGDHGVALGAGADVGGAALLQIDPRADSQQGAGLRQTTILERERRREGQAAAGAVAGDGQPPWGGASF
jgi:hypothetical protein